MENKEIFSFAYRSFIDALDVILVGAGDQLDDILVAVLGRPVQRRLQHRQQRETTNKTINLSISTIPPPCPLPRGNYPSEIKADYKSIRRESKNISTGGANIWEKWRPSCRHDASSCNVFSASGEIFAN